MNAVNVCLVTFIIQHNRMYGVFLLCKITNLLIYSYLYYFTHVMPGENDFGAFHTSDVPYFLNIFSDLRADYWTEEDYQMGEIMSSYLLNFAKTGDPNGEGLTEWTPSEGEFTIFNLDVECSELSMTEEQKQFFEDYYSSLEQTIEEAAK